MFSLYPTTLAKRHEQGFTLVEVMVGMVIAMLGIIIMMQMLALFEGQKRTTTGGDDAQNAGAIAMYGLQQNIQQAGYCFSATAPTLPAVGNLRPVMIDVAAINTINDANTNTLLVTYGNDSCPPESASGVASAATLNVLAYAVRGGNLMQCDYLANDCSLPASWVLIAGDIVSMKAECVGTQGVRLALVARNHQLEKSIITGSGAAVTAPTWSGTSQINLGGSVGIDAGFTWQNYRYKTFETLAPIRNTLWTGGAGC